MPDTELHSLTCSHCGATMNSGDAFCAHCGAKQQALDPRFAAVEQKAMQLRQDFLGGRLTQEQFHAAMSELLVLHDDRYWMVGTASNKWHVHDGDDWIEASPPLAAEAEAEAQMPPPDQPDESEQPPALEQAEPEQAVDRSAPDEEVSDEEPLESQPIADAEQNEQLADGESEAAEAVELRFVPRPEAVKPPRKRWSLKRAALLTAALAGVVAIGIAAFFEWQLVNRPGEQQASQPQAEQFTSNECAAHGAAQLEPNWNWYYPSETPYARNGNRYLVCANGRTGWLYTRDDIQGQYFIATPYYLQSTPLHAGVCEAVADYCHQ